MAADFSAFFMKPGGRLVLIDGQFGVHPGHELEVMT
jgi:hypothetical protein